MDSNCLIAADDPYYCGFSARVPNFVKQGKQKLASAGNLAPTSSAAAPDKSSNQQGASGGERQGREGTRGQGGPKYREPGVLPPPSGANSTQSAPNLAHIPQVQPFWWHSRLYPTDVNAGICSPLLYFLVNMVDNLFVVWMTLQIVNLSMKLFNNI